jgi:major membrane immunogen (membrane-anchored lipoprotein)
MNRRMTMVTAIASLALLSACGSSDDPQDTPTTSETTTTGSPTTPEPTIAAASDVVGDWHDVKAKWVVHFHDDGTFVEDFDGVTDFRVGTYAVDGSTVSLIGDDGNTDQGKIEGETLVFNLGTLTRM